MTIAANASPQVLNGSAEPDGTAASMRHAFNLILNYGIDLLDRIAGAAELNERSILPARHAKDPVAAEHRISVALGWLVALARTMDGDRVYLLRRRDPRRTTPSRALPLFRPLGGLTSLASVIRRRYRRAFATRAIGRIARKICNDVGIGPNSDQWPAHLVDLTQTPAVWHAVHYPLAPAEPPAPPPSPPASPPPASSPPSSLTRQFPSRATRPSSRAASLLRGEPIGPSPLLPSGFARPP